MLTMMRHLTCFDGSHWTKVMSSGSSVVNLAGYAGRSTLLFQSRCRPDVALPQVSCRTSLKGGLAIMHVGWGDPEGVPADAHEAGLQVEAGHEGAERQTGRRYRQAGD